MVGRCVAASCSNTTKDGVSLYQFPGDPILRTQWTYQVQRTRSQWQPSERSVLCSNDFTAESFEPSSALGARFNLKIKRKLKPGAVPSIFPQVGQG